ncbi:chemotaxis protein CheX [Paenibacillus kobensis]|uniref:chemotaxis protein CheX n=1 Tax=Paenibacillus kobensis TaxID=59841 RepID=UPI000FDAAC92|nr:chemotaxis protein CheX [Paenibacillus kobensis]
MKAEYINPFLESAKNVIEQVVQIKPATGQPGLKPIAIVDNLILVQIDIHGQMQGHIVFGISEPVALKMISAMMGGFAISQIDDIGKSAISELSNMISGNASTLLFNQGVQVDITPPVIVTALNSAMTAAKALTIPLIMDGIGEMDIQVLFAS